MPIAAPLAAGLGLALTAVGTGVAVVGSIAGAASQAKAAQQAEDIAKRNRQIAEENAQRALIVSQDEQIALDREAAALIGEQEAVQSGSGLRLSSPSFVMTRRAARQLARQDALNVREAAEIRAEAYRNEGDSYAAEAAAARTARGNAMLGGFLNVASSLVGGASSALRIAPNRTGGLMQVPGATYV